MSTEYKVTFARFLRVYFGVVPLLVLAFYMIAATVLLLPGYTSIKLTRILGVSEPLSKVLGVIFGGVALALLAGRGSMALFKLGQEIRDREIDVLFASVSIITEAIDRQQDVVEESTRALLREGSQERESLLGMLHDFGSKLDTLRGELVTTKSEIKDAEARLRGEWRFVVGLIAAILLGVIPIVLGMVSLLRGHPSPP